MKLFRRKHRSVVRIIASIIPDFMWNFFLPVTPRMYLCSSIMDRILSLRHNVVQSDDDSFSTFRSHFSNHREAVVLYSTPKKHQDREHSRIRELQRELDEIQKQITKLMEHQCDQFHCSGYQTLTNPPRTKDGLVISS